MSSSSSYPCTWCEMEKKNLKNCGCYRTIESSLKNYQEWCKNGKINKKAKNFKSCINPPIFEVNENTEFLGILPPPQLHLLLGAVNTIFEHMLNENRIVCLQCAKLCGVECRCIYGSPSFVGNDCNDLLEQIDLLDAMKCLELAKYVESLRKLKKVFFRGA